MANVQESGASEFAPTPEDVDTTIDQATTEPIITVVAPASTPKPTRPTAGARFKAGWAAFRLWRLQRPFWGSILMFLASLLMLYGPVSLLGVMFVPGSAVPIALTVGALMLVMSLAQLFVPAHALITGLIGIVLSIASLITGSFGGLGIGLILGILGSAQGVAWKAKARPLPTKGSRTSIQNKGAIRQRFQRRKGGKQQFLKQP